MHPSSHLQISIRAVLLSLSAFAFLVCASVSPRVAAAQKPDWRQAEKVLDHFLCYTVPSPIKPKDRAFTDQFNQELPVPVKLDSRVLHCNPVAKNPTKETPKSDERPAWQHPGHLECYRATLEHGKKMPPVPVVIANQFGESQSYTVEAPLRMCVPTGKALEGHAKPAIPANLNHFVCYTIRRGRFQQTVNLHDQFHTYRDVHLTAPAFLCNPAEKFDSDGKPEGTPTNTFAHLMCYTIAPTGLQGLPIAIVNQIETARFSPVAAAVLCVPSTKEVVEQ